MRKPIVDWDIEVELQKQKWCCSRMNWRAVKSIDNLALRSQGFYIQQEHKRGHALFDVSEHFGWSKLTIMRGYIYAISMLVWEIASMIAGIQGTLLHDDSILVPTLNIPLVSNHNTSPFSSFSYLNDGILFMLSNRRLLR